MWSVKNYWINRSGFFINVTFIYLVYINKCMLLWNKIHLMTDCMKTCLPNTNTPLCSHYVYVFEILIWRSIIPNLINLYVNYMNFVHCLQAECRCSFSKNGLFLVLYSCHKTISMQISPPVFVCSWFILENFFLVSLQKTLYFFLS